MGATAQVHPDHSLPALTFDPPCPPCHINVGWYKSNLSCIDFQEIMIYMSASSLKIFQEKISSYKIFQEKVFWSNLISLVHGNISRKSSITENMEKSRQPYFDYATCHRARLLFLSSTNNRVAWNKEDRVLKMKVEYQYNLSIWAWLQISQRSP